jgi:hypothetical protein
MFDYLLSRGAPANNKLILVYILPRLLPSQYDEDMWAYEVELPELSQLKHRLALDPGNAELEGKIRHLENTVPREIRARYESVYAESFNTGLRMMQWLDLGIADEVVIGLDDSAEFGLNVMGFNDLKQHAAANGQEHAFFLHGADELAPLIIARHTLPYDGSAEDFQLRRLSAFEDGALLPYEAIPIGENFSEKAAYLYAGKQMPGAKLAPYPSRPKSVYLFTDRDATQDDLSAVWKVLRSDSQRPSGALVGLVDAAKVNGAWVPLIESAGPDRVYANVDSYAGWNTAGNSMGTVMAHMMFWEAAQRLSGIELREALSNHENLQKLRLIDDYVFQSRVRQEIIDWMTKEGYHYLSFGSRWSEANEKLQAMMESELARWPKLMPTQMLNRFGTARDAQAHQAYPYQFAFPWPRSFEIRISAI